MSDLPAPGDAPVTYRATVLTDWVRAMMVPQALMRLYDIGMGITQFDRVEFDNKNQPVVVKLPAEARVQVSALSKVVDAGQITRPVSPADAGEPVDGVLALGEWELAAARAEVHTLAPAQSLDTPDASAPATPAAAPLDYTPPDGHEIVVVEEGIGITPATSEDRPPRPIREPLFPTAAERALANLRRLRSKKKAAPSPASPASPLSPAIPRDTPDPEAT